MPELGGGDLRARPRDRQRSPDLRCAYCHEPLEEVEATCLGCSTALHHACGLEFERCPTLGCTGRPIRPLHTAAAEQPREEEAPSDGLLHDVGVVAIWVLVGLVASALIMAMAVHIVRRILGSW